MNGGDPCAPSNYDYPFQDTFCELRSGHQNDTPMCPDQTHGHHQGNDIRPPQCFNFDNFWVVAAEGGHVTWVPVNSSTFWVTVTLADGSQDIYLHMSNIQVSLNQAVTRGQRLGMLSNQFNGTPTTRHLHFEIVKNVAGLGLTNVSPYMSLVQSYRKLIGPLSVGVTIQTTGATNVRTQPGGNTTIGTEPVGATGQIIGGPQVANFNSSCWIWWQIQWANGLTGWSIENYMVSGSAPPPLSVVLAASPSSGNAPLNGVSLTASVTGSAQQTINYTFYCDRPDTGVNITTPYDWKVNGTFTNPLTIPNLCNYSSSGTRYAKVIAEQGTGQVQSQAIINVGQAPSACYSLALARNTSSGGGLPTASPANSSGCAAGRYTAGQSIQVSASPATGWSVGGWSGTQNDASTSTVNSLVMPSSSASVTVNYISTPAIGDVRVEAKLNGTLWSGPIDFYLQGYYGYEGHAVASTFHGVVGGNYALSWNGGTPPGATFSGITPSANQFLSSGGSITFTLNFTTPAGWPINLITGQADSITQTSAVLHGSANPNGAQTNGLFWIFGPYPDPGSATSSVNLGSTWTDQPFSISVSGLNCGTTYLFMADAINGFGESNAGGKLFNTAACGTSSSATSFYTLTPCRLVDTRNSNDPITTNEGRTLFFVGTCGIPPTAKAVSFNVTAVNASADGFLSLYPASAAPPSTSTISFRQGRVRANNGIVGLSSNGAMTVYCGLVSSGTVDYVVDVNGYFQ
jgi:cold shock CspA family protein